MLKEQNFVHNQANNAVYETRGLRSYFEYRDLGVAGGSNGEVVAHVIRAKEGHKATGQWHAHDCTFQMYYVIKGWINFDREMEHSEDLELIEIVSPADFKTREIE